VKIILVRIRSTRVITISVSLFTKLVSSGRNKIAISLKLIQRHRNTLCNLHVFVLWVLQKTNKLWTFRKSPINVIPNNYMYTDDAAMLSNLNIFSIIIAYIYYYTKYIL